MAVNDRHRQKVHFTKYLDSKTSRFPNTNPENISVKYVNNRYSPNQLQNSNSASDQRTITIIVKKKKQRKKGDVILQRFKKSNEAGFITISDYLKILAKKCSTPEAHQAHVGRNQKKRPSSDTCLNMSTPFKTKTVVNTLSICSKSIPPGCKNLLNHPLMQAQLSIYRCQLNTKKNSGCKTCNSAAIFEVVKCLYDCYKRKKCDPCKCVVCGYLPKDIRKLIHEAGKSHASVGVETAGTDQKTRSTMTSQEDEMLSLLKSEHKPEKDYKISESEKLRIAKAFGILTPPESQGAVKIDSACQRKNHANYNAEIEHACPEVDVQLEKNIYMTNQSDTEPALRVPSKKLRKARASGLLTPLEGKTPQQREKMLRHLAMNDIPLPDGKTESEKNVISKVRREVGLPPGPRTAEEKHRYVKAQAEGLMKPLKGKSQAQKENILRSLQENGLPLPEGRTPQERDLINKIELECFLKPVIKPTIENKIRHRARSYVHTLFNKFANVTGYMVLVETSCIKDKCNLRAKGFLTPMKVTSPNKEELNVGSTRPEEIKSLEKALFQKVEIGVRLIPEPLGNTQIRTVTRRTEKQSVEPHDSPVVTKKFVKKQPDSRRPLEGRVTNTKDKLLSSTKTAGNLDIRTRFENLFDQKINDKARYSNVISESTSRRKLSKPESKQVKVIQSLANARLSLTKDYILSEKDNINKVIKPKVLEKKTRQACGTGTIISQKIGNDMVTKLNSKLASRINEDLENTGVCERSVACDMKKLSLRKSYLTIKLSVSDVSNMTTPRKFHSVFTDTKDIRQLSDIATSIPSILNLNSTAVHDVEPLDEIPTKEIKKNKNNSPNDLNHTLDNEDEKSLFSFQYASDTDDTESQSHDNDERYLNENADLIYIYKPTFEYNTNGKLTTTSRIILKDSYNISPTASGSLYLIETGSTETCDTGTTNDSDATKDQSEHETGTDVFYLQQTDDDFIAPSSETRILWFYRNSIHKTGRPAGKDTMIYLVPEVKMQQYRDKAAQQQHKKQRCSLHSPHDADVVRTAPRQSLKRASSIVLVMPPSREELSSEDLGSMIYVEKLDSVSKVKSVKLVTYENTPTINPTTIIRRHARNEEKIKLSSEPRTGEYTTTRPVPASHRLPVTNAFTKCPCGSTNRENKLEYCSIQLQKPRIPPKYSDYSKVTAELPAWNKQLYSKPPSCSTTCRLDVHAEQQIGRSEQQQTPVYIETGLKTIETTRRNKDPLYKALTRYLENTKRIVCKEKPEQRTANKNSKVCLISATHSSVYRVHSKVSFSDELKYWSRGNSSEIFVEKFLDPKSSPKRSPRQGSNDHTLRFASDEKTKRLRERTPQFKIKIAPKSSKSSIKTPRSARESKVHFDRPLHSCCTCEKTPSQKSDPNVTIDELKPCASEKKTIKKSEPDRSIKEPKPQDSTNETSQQSKPDHPNDELRPRVHEKEEAKKSECNCSKKEPKPFCRKKNTELSNKETNPCQKKRATHQSDTDVLENEAAPYVNERKPEQSGSDSKKLESKQNENPKQTPKQSNFLKSFDSSKNESKPCENKKKISEPSGSDSPRSESKPREKNKMPCQYSDDLSKNESKRCEKEAEKNKKTIDQQPDHESTDAKGTKNSPCESPRQTASEQHILITESDSQSHDTVKRTSSPLNVNVESTRADDSTVKPSCLVENPRTVSPGKGEIPEKPLYICDGGSSAKFKFSENICTRNNLIMNTTEKPRSDTSVKQNKSETDLNRISTIHNTDHCVKHKITMEQYCPPKTLDQITQPGDVCDRLKQQLVSECPANPSNNEPQSVDENIKLKEQTTLKILSDASQDSVAQLAKDISNKCKQKSPKCQADSSQDSVAKPVIDNPNKCKQTASKCRANSSQDLVAQPTKDNTEKYKQTASKCPADSSQDLVAQPAKDNPEKCERNEPNKKLVSEGPAYSKKPAEEKDVLNQNNPCQPLVKNNDDKEQPAQELPDIPAKCRKACAREPLTQQTEPYRKPCSNILKYIKASDNDKKHGRVWWCKKKQILPRRYGQPPPIRSVEDNSTETQCERDDKDQAQMTDEIIGMEGDPEQCLCSVKPCKCLQELAQTMASGGGKPNRECECLSALLIRNKNQEEHYKTETEANFLKEQQSFCSCIAFLQKHNLLHTGQTKVNQTTTEEKGPGPKSEQLSDTPCIDSLNSFCQCEQNKIVEPQCYCKPLDFMKPTAENQKINDVTCQGTTSSPDRKKNIICECPPPIVEKKMTADQNGKSGSRPGKRSYGNRMKNIICECPQLKATEKTAGGQSSKDETFRGKILVVGDKINLTSKCPQPKAIEQKGNNRITQGKSPTGKKSTTFGHSRPTAEALEAGGESGKVDKCRCMLSTPGGKETAIYECLALEATEQKTRGQNDKNGTCQGVSDPSGKKTGSFECTRPNKTDNKAGAVKGNVCCSGMSPGPGGTKMIICECPPLKATDQAPGSQYGIDGMCKCMTSGLNGKVKVRCECPQPTVIKQMVGGQDGTAGLCQCTSGSNKNIICECPRPTPAELTASQICRNGTCQEVSSGPFGAPNTCVDGPRPTTIVKEETAAIQCKKGEQRSCDNLSKAESGKKSQKSKSTRFKKTVLCESPSKDKLQNTVDRNKVCLSLKKKKPGQAGEGSSSEECPECQSKKTRVKWCQKKYVISERPPLALDNQCDSSCLSSQKEKPLKKNDKNEAKTKTGEQKLDTLCTHGSNPCLCKEEPSCRLKKNHKCECPCPLFVEEVDLNADKDCPQEPPRPKDCSTDENDKNNQKKNLVECDRGQMTPEKIDKFSSTDRQLKNISKTKNKSSGQGKWGKKKLPTCICPPEPPTTETGCDPPCLKEQWKMKSREATCNKSGFSVKKKPAVRVDHTMCFEEALAYFELHPEDDPMQKKKRKVICECPPTDGSDSFLCPLP